MSQTIKNISLNNQQIKESITREIRNTSGNTGDENTMC
jgi:hypothetical protein